MGLAINQPVIPAHCNPIFLQTIKAKSDDGRGYQQTLAEHTWAVLTRLADMQQLHQSLPAIMTAGDGAISSGLSIGIERVWLRQFYVGFLHDFGKAAQGFQLRLNEHVPESTWVAGRHRHEVLSLGYVHWLFPAKHQDRIPILLSIATHHKDMHEVLLKYGAKSRTSDQRMRLEWLAGQVSEIDQRLLWQWLYDYRSAWRRELGFTFEDDLDLQPFTIVDAKQIAAALDDCSDYLLRYQDIMIDTEFLTRDLLNRGLILTADHAGSAGTEPFPGLPLTSTLAQQALSGRTLRDHQRAAAMAQPGSAILIAPTGSGKTEAALLWAAQQMEHRPAARLFYTLPYQASMNAMYRRLACDFFGASEDELRRGQHRTVTIQHGRALLKHYQEYMNWDESSPQAARRTAKQLQNLAQLNFYPVQVFSPYQMLKAAYRLKGYETLLLDYAGALFIFDEIHAYEPKRLALIITFMQWLHHNLNARFLVMTATLPPPVLSKLQQALAIEPDAIIHATPEDFRRAQRHVVHILKGQLEDTIVKRVKADLAAGKSVLVCLNRIGDAQSVYRLLKEELRLSSDVENDVEADSDAVDIVLLHGRFDGEDRSRKEAILTQRARVGQNAAQRRPFVCVATQVVEVSLNVDFDTIYSAPAPLEALLQRFGRVNRGRPLVDGRLPALCPVHVFRLPSGPGGKKPYLPYQESMVLASMKVLEAHCGGRPIDESMVTVMLAEIYRGAVAVEWEAEYKGSADSFASAILNTMEPCESADRTIYRQFFELFDGMEILPEDLSSKYYDARDANGYLAASRYLVNISYQQYKEFGGYGLITPARDLEGEYADHIDVAYSREFGLDLDGARQEHKQQSQSPTEDF